MLTIPDHVVHNAKALQQFVDTRAAAEYLRASKVSLEDALRILVPKNKAN